MIYLGVILGILAIIFIILDRYQTEEGFRTMIKFLDDNLYFNNTKIICATLYIIGVNIKWGSHSLYLNRDTCINGNFIDFNLELLNTNIDFMQAQKKEALKLGKEFKTIITEKHLIGINIYKFKEKEIYKFNLDNILTFLINTGIKIIDTYNEYYPNNCSNISKELGLSGINIKNLIEISYYAYSSNISGFTGEEKRKKLSKNSNRFPIFFCTVWSDLLHNIFLLCVLYISFAKYRNIFFRKINQF